MYTISKVDYLLGRFVSTMQKVNFLWSELNYIQFSKVKCKKIARTMYFYITRIHSPIAAASKSTVRLA